MLKKRIQEDMVKAMKAGEKEKRDLLRFIMAQIKQSEVDTRADLTESDVLAVIRREIKQSEEARSIADTEQLKWRVDFLKGYLPQQLSEAAIYQIVSEYKIGQSDMRTAMKELMAKYGDVADRKVLSNTIKRVYA